MTTRGRRVKCAINERRVRRHDEYQANMSASGEGDELQEIEEVPLEFPCHDSSKGVKDFKDWSYFKKLEKKKIVK